MFKANHLIILILLFCFTVHSHAASFDCSKATTLVENAICNDVEISALDDLLMDTYKKALANTDDQSGLKGEQRSWLKNKRNTCKNVACVKQAYVLRISELNGLIKSDKSSISISGEYERYDGNKPDYHGSTITIKELKDGQIHVVGNAVWIGNAETGNVNTGDIDGTFPLKGNQVNYIDGGCDLTLTFSKNGLTVDDKSGGGCSGLNVTFSGEYRKVNGQKNNNLTQQQSDKQKQSAKQIVKGVISDYGCGDNCYLTITTAGGKEISGLCTAPLCQQWNEKAEMPAEFKGKKVIVTVGKGFQYDGEGNVMGEMESFEKIDMLK